MIIPLSVEWLASECGLYEKGNGVPHLAFCTKACADVAIAAVKAIRDTPSRSEWCEPGDGKDTCLSHDNRTSS